MRVDQVVGGLCHLAVAEGDDQVYQLGECAEGPGVLVPGGWQLAEGLVDSLGLVGPADDEQGPGQRGPDDRDRRSGRGDVEEVRGDLPGVTAEDRQPDGEYVRQARAGRVLDPEGKPARFGGPVPGEGELAGQRRAGGLLAQQVPAGQRQPGRFGELRDLGDLRVNRLEVQQLVGGIDPPHPAEYRGQRLAGRGGQLDGPGAQPQPLGPVLWR